jgi:hypothetical protein
MEDIEKKPGPIYEKLSLLFALLFVVAMFVKFMFL